MKYHKIHKILVRGDDFSHAEKRVTGFFAKTTILRYDTLSVSAEESLQATQEAFWDELEAGIAANRKVMAEFAAELKDSKVTTLEEALTLRDAYSCKLIHLIAHFLDGFIGIDSVFYSLSEDSHWLSPAEQKNIETSPQKYWLLQVKGDFSSREEASFILNV